MTRFCSGGSSTRGEVGTPERKRCWKLRNTHQQEQNAQRRSKDWLSERLQQPRRQRLIQAYRTVKPAWNTRVQVLDVNGCRNRRVPLLLLHGHRERGEGCDEYKELDALTCNPGWPCEGPGEWRCLVFIVKCWEIHCSMYRNFNLSADRSLALSKWEEMEKEQRTAEQQYCKRWPSYL